MAYKEFDEVRIPVKNQRVIPVQNQSIILVQWRPVIPIRSSPLIPVGYRHGRSYHFI
jgi:hypothetical protein